MLKEMNKIGRDGKVDVFFEIIERRGWLYFGA